jgi:hypothetical protein
MTDDDVQYVSEYGAMTPDGFTYVGYGIMSDDPMEWLEYRNGGPPYRNGPHATPDDRETIRAKWFVFGFMCAAALAVLTSLVMS